MHTLTWFFAWLILLLLLAYHRVSLVTATITIVIALFASYYQNSIGITALVFTISITIIISYLLLHASFRRKYLVNPILQLMQTNLPKMSATESEALQAGTVWWDGELFSGNPNWNKLINVDLLKLSQEEINFINGPVEELCSMIDTWQIDYVLQDIPPEIWKFIKDQKFFGLIIPKEYGGLEFSALAHSDILAKIGGKSATVASTVAVPNSLGPAELLLHYGTNEQKQYYLNNLASGKEIPCFALTAPNAGSDATSITDTGIVCTKNFNGKPTLGILLNWNKRYITLAPIATVMGLAFKLYDPDHLLGTTTDIGITCALIPTNTPGITIGDRHWPLLTMFQNGPIHGKDVFIPIDWIIGGPSMAGKGWTMLVESLSCGRAISLPSVTAGKGRVVAAATGAYAKIRRQFNQSIGKFEGVEEPLARIAANVYICNAARRITAASIDLGEQPTVPGAIVKYHVTERMRNTGIDAMDVHGGKGIMQGPKNYLAEAYINAPVGITVEGANILTRGLIIFGQGAIRCHPYIMRELQALQETNNDQALIQFDQVLMQHMGYTVSNIARAFCGYITLGSLISVPVKHASARYYRWISWGSSAFAVLADASLMSLGGKLKFKEKLSGRLGDLLSLLYLASTTLKRYSDEGNQKDDLVLIEWCMKDLMHSFWRTAAEILDNLPNRWLACILRLIVMPFGIPIKKPSDYLGHKVAQILLQPNSTRDRIINGAYLPANKNNPVGQLEQALVDVLAAEEIDKRVGSAIKDGTIKSIYPEEQVQQALQLNIINEAEAVLLRKANAARNEVIAVDYFSAKDMVARGDN